MIPAGILVYRDDTGRTVSEKLAQRARIFRSRPALGSFLVMLAIINVAYLMYGAAFTAIKWSKAATSVACPGRIRTPRSLILRAFTRRTAKRARIPSESCPPGSAASPTGVRLCNSDP